MAYKIHSIIVTIRKIHLKHQSQRRTQELLSPYTAFSLYFKIAFIPSFARVAGIYFTVGAVFV